MRGPTGRRAGQKPAIHVAREAVLVALVKGPRTGIDLHDTLVVRVGSKNLVKQGITRAHSDGLIVAQSRSGPWVTWKLTDEGVKAAAELLTPKAAA